jgi:hypothetical protein
MYRGINYTFLCKSDSFLDYETKEVNMPGSWMLCVSFVTSAWSCWFFFLPDVMSYCRRTDNTLNVLRPWSACCCLKCMPQHYTEVRFYEVITFCPSNWMKSVFLLSQQNTHYWFMCNQHTKSYNIYNTKKFPLNKILSLFNRVNTFKIHFLKMCLILPSHFFLSLPNCFSPKFCDHFCSCISKLLVSSCWPL